jgi:hypothetical protein
MMYRLTAQRHCRCQLHIFVLFHQCRSSPHHIRHTLLCLLQHRIQVHILLELKFPQRRKILQGKLNISFVHQCLKFLQDTRFSTHRSRKSQQGMMNTYLVQHH